MSASASLVAVLVLAPAGLLAAQVAQPGSSLRIGVMTMHGKAGIVTHVSPSEISLAVPEHVAFTVHILPGTRFTQDGQSVSEDAIQPDTAIFVHGSFDMQARTADAEAIDLVTQSTPLRKRMENYGKTWTSGVITALGNGSITIQHLDGSSGTLVVNSSSTVLFHSDPALLSDLRRGEQVDVGLERNNPSAAETIRIQGMVSGYQ